MGVNDRPIALCPACPHLRQRYRIFSNDHKSYMLLGAMHCENGGVSVSLAGKISHYGLPLPDTLAGAVVASAAIAQFCGCAGCGHSRLDRMFDGCAPILTDDFTRDGFDSSSSVVGKTAVGKLHSSDALWNEV